MYSCFDLKVNKNRKKIRNVHNFNWKVNKNFLIIEKKTYLLKFNGASSSSSTYQVMVVRFSQFLLDKY